MYKATVSVTRRKSILDPQGKAVDHALRNLGIDNTENVRIGKLITFDIETASAEDAENVAQNACTQLLVNEVMEDFSITIDEKDEKQP